MKFKDFLSEGLKNNFIISINGKTFNIIRSFHVRTPRANSNIPRDGSMSINKYTEVLKQGLNHIDTSVNNPFTITWSKNSKNNAISGEFIEDDTIKIFGAIMNDRKSSPDKLYALKGKNRYHIKDTSF